MSGNFRTHLLSLSLLVVVADPQAAIAQAPISNITSDSIEDQVTSLERISNAHSQLLTQFQQQLSDTQLDVDALRGRIQENRYQLSQLDDRQKRIFNQLDNSSQGNDGASTTGATCDASCSTAEVLNIEAVKAPTSVGDVNSDYSAAVSLALERKRYDEAIAAFQIFIKKYPDSTYQPNAHYWLGLLYYSKGEKDDAAHYFAVLVKNYPESLKTPDAMFKVGVIMQEKGEVDKANAVFTQVIKQYPDADAARRAQESLSAK